MIKTGYETYVGAVRELYDPVVEIGNFSQIANGVTFIGGGEHPSVMDRNVVANYPFRERWGIDAYPATGSNGDIKIGHDVWIGEDVTILSGARIGSGAIVGAESVIAGIVYPYAIVVGNPATEIDRRFDYDVIADLKRIAWYTWPIDVVREAVEKGYFNDIHKFIEKYG